MVCEEIIQMKLPNLRAFLLIKQNLLKKNFAIYTKIIGTYKVKNS
jgi:hypothetical protein